MTIRRLTTIAVLFSLAAVLLAMAKPNFSGSWKLNVSKSDFGQMPAPDSATYKIVHEDPKLRNSVKQSSQAGEFEFEASYTTDGKECVNQMFGNDFKSTLKWDGDALLIESTGHFGDNDITINEKWTLSEDGKTITIARTFKSAMGEGEQKVVLEKQ